MYRIKRESSDKVVTKRCKKLRAESKEEYLNLRKVYNNLRTKVFDNTDVKNLVTECTVKAMKSETVEDNINLLLELIEFEEIEDELDLLDDMEDLDLESDNINCYSNRYDFISTTDINHMTCEQLSLMLFKELGSEAESKVVNMSVGLKIKTDLLDELKQFLLTNYADIRQELLTQKIANALALVKQHTKSSSLSLDNKGELLVWQYLSSKEVADKDITENMKYLADINSTKLGLDQMILKSTLAVYVEEVEKGNLEIPSRQLIIAVKRAISGAKQASQDTMDKAKNLTF